MMNKKQLNEKFQTQRLVWDSRNFGAYTLSMTMMGLSLGAGQWFILLSIVFFGLSLYIYAKNKEDMEFEDALNKKVFEVK